VGAGADLIIISRPAAGQRPTAAVSRQERVYENKGLCVCGGGGLKLEGTLLHLLQQGADLSDCPVASCTPDDVAHVKSMAVT
jgi:hypothetical protein